MAPRQPQSLRSIPGLREYSCCLRLYQVLTTAACTEVMTLLHKREFYKTRTLWNKIPFQESTDLHLARKQIKTPWMTAMLARYTCVLYIDIHTCISVCIEMYIYIYTYVRLC